MSVTPMPWSEDRVFRKSEVIRQEQDGRILILIPPMNAPHTFVADDLDHDRWIRAHWIEADPAQEPPCLLADISISEAMRDLSGEERRFVVAETEAAVDWTWDQGWVGEDDDAETRWIKGSIAAAGLRLQIELAEFRATQPFDFTAGC